MTDENPPEPKAKKRRRRAGKSLMWLLNLSLAAVTVTVLIIGGIVFYLRSAPVTAPDWAREMIELRLAEAMPQTQVRFGEMAFLVEDDWKPRVRLRDVALEAKDGREIVRLNEFRATLDGPSLLEGSPRPKRISLSGITAQLERDVDGQVSLRAFEGAAAREAPSLPALLGQVDDVLTSEALSALRSVEIQALTLRYEDARASRAWTVDGGRMVLGRDGGTLRLTTDLAVLSGGAGVATLSANYTREIGEIAAEFGISFDDVAAEDIAAQGPAFAWLGVLRAPISGAVRTGLGEDGRFTPLAATLQIGAGVVQPNEATDPIPFDGGQSYFNYDPDTRALQFDALSVRSKWISGDASGTAHLGLDPETGDLDELIGQISLQGISANPAALYEEPARFAGAELDFRLRLDPFEVDLGRAQISDMDRTLLLSGALAAGVDGWQVAVDGQMDGVDPARLLALWPQRAATKTREWLAQNLKAGDVSNIDLALRRAPGLPPRNYVAFDYDRATVQFAKTLPPVTDARGHFTLGENRLVIAVDDGVVVPPEGGEIAVRGSSFIIPDVTVKEGAPSIVRLNTRSTVTAALSLLNMPPLSVMDKASLPVDIADGTALLEGTLAVPLKRQAKIDFYMAGDVLDVRSDTLVKDRELRAETLRLETDNAGVSLTGQATLDDVPFDGSWSQALGPDAPPGLVAGQIELSPETLKTFGVTLPPGSVSGSGRANLEVTLPRGSPPAFSVTSELQGLRVSVPQVGWSKAPGTAGDLQIAGNFGAPANIETLRIEGPGLSAAGSVALNADATLDRVRFDRVQVGDWLDAPLDLVSRGAGRPPQLSLRGGALDLRRAEFGSGQGGGGSAPLDVRLDRLQITDTIALTNMRGQFQTGGGLDGQFEARLNGEAPVRGQVVPQDGRSAVRLVSENAGSVLSAAGLVRQVVGGNLSLLLLPVGSGGAFDGRLTIKDVRVKNAPGIAALLNAVSVVGLINELNGDGIYFEDVEASFRLTPNRLTLAEGSAVGASMGLSMDGTFATDTGQMDLQGVISPVYLLNGIGSLFTRRGEGLIGFNYTLTGNAKEPVVGVNPLSALTPAMFREIFRAPPPDLPEVEGVTESTLPEVTRPRQRPVAREYEGR